MENNTQLPVEVVEEIKEKAKLSADFLSNDEHVVADHIRGYEQGWGEGATAYATKLVECDKANSTLEEKNRQLLELLEANFKEALRSYKCMTEEQINEAWEGYKTNNNL